METPDKTPLQPPIDPSQTEEGQARAREYRLALGTFVDAFAKVEAGMYLSLCWHTKTAHRIGQAIFSGTRVETAASFLGRLAENGTIDAAEWLQLKPVLTQLRVINDARNLILHHGAQGVESGRALVADALRALTVERIRIIPISPTILDAMTHDCRKIFLHIVTQHCGRPTLDGTQRVELDEALGAAWRYIPPRQSPPHPKADKTRRSRRPDSDQPPPRRPSASQE